MGCRSSKYVDQTPSSQAISKGGRPAEIGDSPRMQKAVSAKQRKFSDSSFLSAASTQYATPSTSCADLGAITKFESSSPILSLPLPVVPEVLVIHKSRRMSQFMSATVTVKNNSHRNVTISFLDYEGIEKVFRESLPAWDSHTQETFVGSAWRVRDIQSNEILHTYRVEEEGHTVFKVTDLDDPIRSIRSNEKVNLLFINQRSRPVKIYWVHYDGTERFITEVKSWGQYPIMSFVGHAWCIREVDSEQEVNRFTVETGRVDNYAIVHLIPAEPDSRSHLKKQFTMKDDESTCDSILQSYTSSGWSFAGYTSNPIHELTENLKTTEKRFFDRSFPPVSTSLGSPEFQSLQWKRISDLHNYPRLFGDNMTSANIKQGKLRNCYLMQVLAALPSKPNVLSELVTPSSYNPLGVYSVKLYYFNQPIYIVVDDYLPVQAGTDSLFFAKMADSSLFWVSIVEKAFAKLNRSYFKLDSDHTLTPANLVLGLITGRGSGAGRVFDWHIDATVDNVQPLIQQDRFWSLLLKLFCEERLVVCSSKDQDTDGLRSSTLHKNQLIKANGIVARHGYTICKLAEENLGESSEKVRLLCLRNSWGKRDWNGDWSNGSPLWDSYPEIRANLCPSEDMTEHGLFWMSYDDFISNFEVVYTD
eukprot:GILK01009634.1.p1 GENE.GILK01009634.1~~GILK01009634.1.p1  ORF type:complete len:645 (+),score=97.49 GILK01009634.1:109-2043(+)